VFGVILFDMSGHYPFSRHFKLVLVSLVLTSSMESYISASALDDATKIKVDQLFSSGARAEAVELLLAVDPTGVEPEIQVRIADAIAEKGIWNPDARAWSIARKDGSILQLPLNPETSIERLLQASPTSASLWVAQANLAWARSRTQNLSNDEKKTAVGIAAKAYEKSLQFGLSNPLALERLGLLALDNGDESRAIDWLEAARQKQPDRIEILYNLAYALYINGKADRALPYIQQVFNSSSGSSLHANARLLYGEVFLANGKWAEAAKAFQQASDHDPNNLYPLRRLVECMLVSGDPGRLDAATRAYLGKAPVLYDAILQLAPLYQKYSKNPQMLGLIRDLRARTDKSRTEDIAGLSWLEAQILLSNNQKKEAIAALSDGIAAFGDPNSDSQLLQELKNFKAQLEKK